MGSDSSLEPRGRLKSGLASAWSSLISTLKFLKVHWIFIALVVVVSLFGGGLAVVADPAMRNENALREIGGAILAGGVLALLVAIYEARLDGVRDARERERENSRIQREKDDFGRQMRQRWVEQLINLVVVESVKERNQANLLFAIDKFKAASSALADGTANIGVQRHLDAHQKLVTALSQAETLAKLVDAEEVSDLANDYLFWTLSFAASCTSKEMSEQAKCWQKKSSDDNEKWKELTSAIVALKDRYPVSTPPDGPSGDSPMGP